MDVPVTEGTYSKDSYGPSLCTVGDGQTCWVAWAAYERHGSRVFTRKFDGETAGPIMPISSGDTAALCRTRPICVPVDGRGCFVWLEKVGQTYSVHRCGAEGDSLTATEKLWTLPESAKPWELQALCDKSGTLWVSWAQAVKGKNTVELLRVPAHSEPTHASLDSGSPESYRPRMVEWDEAGIYLVWDSYVGGTYDVYGCSVLPTGPGDVVKISHDAAWENKATICRDRDGRLWAVWVRWQDVMYRDSVIHQRFSLRGAWYDGRLWRPLSSPDGDADIAPLDYGLLTDFSCWPEVGHMGRRLSPILKGAEDGGIWLFYEVKADQCQHTKSSRGRLFAQRYVDEIWSGPYNVVEGNVLYELPRNDFVGPRVFVLSRDVVTDELHLTQAELSTDLPPVPEEHRRVDLAGWEEIRLPFRERREEKRAHNELPGDASGRYKLFWADLHVHSSGSFEVEGEPDELAHYARDKAQIDALTLSDNDSFWNRFKRQNVLHMKDYEWDYIKGNALVLNEPGRFAMFPGYELTITGRAITDRNHRSVMSDDDEMEMDLLEFKHLDAYMKGKRITHKDIEECIAWARRKGYLALPHPHYGYWGLVDTGAEWGVDVCAAWMINFDLYDIFFKYLDEGHKFAFTGSSDSHYRNPGYGGALTGIWAEQLDRASLLEALKARRCYATAGQRIVVEFTINDQVMGSSMVVEEDPVLKWRVVGEVGQEYILRIHRDGRLMHEDRFIERTRGELEEHMMWYRPGQHYYYLEVLSPDPIPQYPRNVAHAMGARAWSTPIWVEFSDAGWAVDSPPAKELRKQFGVPAGR
jgi:hypothetical protein